MTALFLQRRDDRGRKGLKRRRVDLVDIPCPVQHLKSRFQLRPSRAAAYPFRDFYLVHFYTSRFSYIVDLCLLANNGNDGQITVNIFYLLRCRKNPFFWRFPCYDKGVFFFLTPE
uniref:Uncharacterized protein n=1 Tax=Siphoviridae sp. cthae16 TaxID=2825617 RepID=A0A8S5URK4_9CAUD|nr:MAG TPA: hypothetical protein [Siphoviridae sp. cthae16]